MPADETLPAAVDKTCRTKPGCRVTRETNRCLPNSAAIRPCREEPQDPRCRRSRRAQQPRRQRECAVRRVAVICQEQLARDGTSKQQAADRLGASARTLRHWRRRDKLDGLAAHPRGRPPATCDVQTRNDIIGFLHHVTGPAIGLPALQVLFSEVPTVILENLLWRYRRVWRRRYRRQGYRLEILSNVGYEFSRRRRIWVVPSTGASSLLSRSPSVNPWNIPTDDVA